MKPVFLLFETVLSLGFHVVLQLGLNANSLKNKTSKAN